MGNALKNMGSDIMKTKTDAYIIPEAGENAIRFLKASLGKPEHPYNGFRHIVITDEYAMSTDGAQASLVERRKLIADIPEGHYILTAWEDEYYVLILNDEKFSYPSDSLIKQIDAATELPMIMRTHIPALKDRNISGFYYSLLTKINYPYDYERIRNILRIVRDGDIDVHFDVKKPNILLFNNTSKNHRAILMGLFKDEEESKCMNFWTSIKNGITNTVKFHRNRWQDHQRLVAALDNVERQINRVIIHHSASDSRRTTVQMIREWHLRRGWQDIGYHLLIDWTGELHYGRELRISGAHCRGHNEDSLGVCCIGNYEQEKPTDALLDSLRYTVEGLCCALNLDPREAVHGHNHYAATACPGRYLVEEMGRWWGKT